MAVVAKITGKVAGTRQMIREGTSYPDDHPVVKARPELFESADDYLARNRRPTNTADLRPVERATAAPGEKRATKRPKKDDDKS